LTVKANGREARPMSDDKDADEPKTGESPASAFFEKAFGFFSEVLKSIEGDNVLRLAWAVEVLLFVVLALMIWFGELTANQRFGLALVIIVSIVFMFVFSARRTRDATAAGSHADIIAQAQKCLLLLDAIGTANTRVLQRGRSEGGAWATLLADKYNHVCHRLEERKDDRRKGNNPAADAYFDVIEAEHAVDTVCKSKYYLGEALDDYRRRIKSASPPPWDHDELELLIRRSVIQPDLSPEALGAAVAAAIAQAEPVLRRHRIRRRTNA